MARYELAEVETASLGQAYASGDVLFELGIKYSTGCSGPADLVSAHKWFNLAAMRGKSEAIGYLLDRLLKVQAGIFVIVLDATQRRHIVHRRIGLLGQPLKSREFGGVGFGLGRVRHRSERAAAPPCAKVHRARSARLTAIRRGVR